MGNRQFANNASAILAGSITNVATSLTVAAGYGSLFPSPTGSQYFVIAVEDTSGNIEIMKCTARSTDTLTVTRAQESTTAQAFTANLARVELRPTAGVAQAWLQADGDTWTGDMNGGGKNLTNVILNGSNVTMENAGEIVNTPIRSATGVTTNQITYPSSGARAQMGGVNLAITTDITTIPSGCVLMWYGLLANIPAGYVLCDGTNSTPNLTDRFVIGAGGSLSPTLGVTGGSVGSTATTSTATTGGATDSHALLEVEMPSHTHKYWGPSAASNVASGSGHGWDWGVANTYQIGAPTGLPGAYPTPNYFIQPTGGTGSPGVAVGPGAPHSHTLSGTAHAHTVAIPNPPFLGLYFIMKS